MKIPDPNPCGYLHCAAALRMLWPVADMSVSHIAAILAMSASSLARRVDHMGIRNTRPQRRRSVYSLALFRRLWDDPTVTYSEIGRALNIDSRTVPLHARRANFQHVERIHGNRGKRFYEWPKDFRMMWKLRVRHEDIASLVGCSRSLVGTEGQRRGYDAITDEGRAVWITMEEYSKVRAEAALKLALERSAKETRIEEILCERVHGGNPTHIRRLTAELAA